MSYISLTFGGCQATCRLNYSLIEQLLIRAASRIPGEKRSGVDPRVETAMAHIEANPSRSLRLEEVAAAANLSVSSLKRLFKAATGLSVIAWRDEQRLGPACRAYCRSSGLPGPPVLQPPVPPLPGCFALAVPR